MMKNKKTALLIMDVQQAIADRLPDDAPVFDALNTAITTARSHKVPVIYVVVGFREGYPEVSDNNKTFGQIKTSDYGLDTEEGMQIHHTVAPKAGDIVIKKRRVSAFTGSDLEVVLRSSGINHLFLSGIATSGVVLSTLREAADKDYAITVLSDCCVDQDEEVHRVLTTKVFTRQAEVINSGDLESFLKQ